MNLNIDLLGGGRNRNYYNRDYYNRDYYNPNPTVVIGGIGGKILAWFSIIFFVVIFLTILIIILVKPSSSTSTTKLQKNKNKDKKYNI